MPMAGLSPPAPVLSRLQAVVRARAAMTAPAAAAVDRERKRVRASFMAGVLSLAGREPQGGRDGAGAEHGAIGERSVRGTARRLDAHGVQWPCTTAIDSSDVFADMQDVTMASPNMTRLRQGAIGSRCIGLPEGRVRRRAVIRRLSLC